MNLRGIIHTGKDGLGKLALLLEQYRNTGMYVLVDENTEKYCFPLLLQHCPILSDSSVIRIKSGEETKNIATASEIWQELSDKGALRRSILLCLGGGVITDLGGFVAATYRRGMDFAYLPTSLLGMVDAGIGGKTALNLNGLKNQIGLFTLPKGVFIFPEFLTTLPEQHLVSGFAEMLKHALISDRSHFQELVNSKMLNNSDREQLILRSASIKIGVVESDPHEIGRRKMLNLGHTIGHALEAYSIQHDADPLLHGEALAAGLICEAFISLRMAGLPESDLQAVSNFITTNYPHYRLKPSACNDIIAYMLKDKKIDSPGKINFSLLNSIGKAVVDQYPGEKLIRESMHFYVNIEYGFFS